MKSINDGPVVDVALDQLAPHPRNANEADVGAIGSMIETQGWYGSIVVQRSTGLILAGNHRYLVAQQNGDASLPVQYVDVDDETALRILVADNRGTRLGRDEPDALSKLLTELAATPSGLVGLGYDGDDLDDLLRDLDGPEPEGAVPALPKVARTKPGDLWLLGEHRLLCGDAVEGLPRVCDEAPHVLVADPPYGINLDTDYSKMTGGSRRSAGRNYDAVVGDDSAYDAQPLRAALQHVDEQFWFGADYYRRTLTDDDYDGAWLVWDKRDSGDSTGSDENFGSGFELIWSARRHQRRILRHYWTGGFDHEGEARQRVHPTQKPTVLIADVVTRWCPPEGIVLDPYAGSGSTILACERVQRRAQAIELVSGYCDVVCARFQAESGIKPILEATGETHDFASSQ